jgi:hypothetical protein
MLALETKHVMEYLQCNQQQQGATMCVNPASLAWVQFMDYICIDMCTYMCSLERRTTRKTGTCFLSFPTAASPMKQVVSETTILLHKVHEHNRSPLTLQNGS